MKTIQEQNNLQEEVKGGYEKPAIEVLELELENSVLLSASKGNGVDNYRPGGGGGAW